MQTAPSPESLAECCDGIGSEIPDSTPPTFTPSTSEGIKTYRHVFLVTFSVFSERGGDAETMGIPIKRQMRIAGNSAEDAVRAVKAAYPTARIHSVD